MVKTTSKLKADKPAKPYLGFPLFAHATKRWAKKIRGRMHYFGPWSDPDTALNKYLEERDDLHAGRMPRSQRNGLIIRELLNRFLTSKRRQVEAREITERSWQDYYSTCRRLERVFGLERYVADLAPDDFDRLKTTLAKTRGLFSIGTEIGRVRAIFRWADDQDLIDQPIRLEPGFRPPSKKVLRIARTRRSERMFTPAQIRAMLNRGGPALKAMILLGINCGFGNQDCASLRLKALDLTKGWVSHARSKTGANRRCPLWPDTIEAIRDVIAKRPAAKNAPDADLVFLTRHGGPWANEKYGSAITHEVVRILTRLKLSSRKGLGFYTLRHVFETIAGETKDQVAVDSIMGHAVEDMASVYRQRISDDRLKAATDYVRSWLFGHTPR